MTTDDTTITADAGHDFDHDVLVVGSGFGGSVTALRLTEKGYRVGVVEAGKRFGAEDFPKTNWNLRKYVFMPKLGLRGIARATLLSDVFVLSGAGVGGGSLVYANTLYEPRQTFWTDSHWVHITDWKTELAPYYAQAKKMLGAERVPRQTPADDVMREVADTMGVADTYRPTDVAVWFGESGVEEPDPFFGGEGPSRTGCTECGGCIVGCRFHAKNTLDQNYLYLAEKNGATVHPERQVVDLVPLSGGGYRVITERPGAWVRKDRHEFTAEQVVFSAGVLGTMKLLASLQSRGRLPQLSSRLGSVVRTNSEAIISATRTSVPQADFTRGVSITSSIYPDDMTHIEPVRYSKGSNLVGAVSTIFVTGEGRVPRWMRFFGQILKHPRVFLQTLSLRRWSERTLTLLVMQTRDNSLRLRWRSRRDGSVRLRSEQGHGEPNPTYLPVAQEAAKVTADVIGGRPENALNEVLLDVPTTAHILGGCCIGASADEGVVDPYQRLFGHPGLHVADASTITANPGVNPSLTITAMAERAMSFWPNKGEPDPRPDLSEPYECIEPVRPAAPAVPSAAPAALGW